MKKGFHILKTLRRIACGVTALLLAISVPLEAIAADYTASNGDELYNSWCEANDNSDASNSFYITNDISMSNTLEAQAGKTYTVSSSGNGDYSISDLHIEAPTSGGGTVIVNTDVTSDAGSAVVVVGDATVAVNGDVTQTSNYDKNHYVAVEAANGADLTINGNVTAGEAGITANHANITIRGDVNLGSEASDSDNNFVIDADMDSNVVVVGDVTTEELGVLAMRDSEVVIYGDLSLNSNFKQDANTNIISASDDGIVRVTGNVSSEEGGIITNDGAVIVGGDVLLDNGNGTGISANNNALVTVDGSVVVVSGSDLGGTGIEANLSSSVTIKEDVIAGSGMLVDDSTVTVNGSVRSLDSSYITNDSGVKIYGDFMLNASDSETALGELVVSGGSSLYMGNETMLKADAIHVLEDSTLDAAFVNTDYASVGVSNSNGKDKSQLSAFTDTANTGIGTLTTAGKSQTILKGKAGDVYASENSYVEIWRDADKIVRSDNARVITNLADKNDAEYYLPEPDVDDYQVGNTTAHTIIQLCQSYTPNSTLQKQYSEMLSLLSGVSNDISGELNEGSALWASLFDHETINTSSYLSNRFNNTAAASFYQNENYNATSVANFKSADSVNTYLITMFKNNLAQSMVDLSTSEAEWKENGYAEDELFLKILAYTKKLDDASGVYLSAEETEFLQNVTDSNGNISGTDMVEFLRRFGRYTENDSGVFLTAQRLSRAYEKIGPYMEDAKLIAKLAKAGVTVYDFMKYYMSDYTNQMIVLDEILATQELSPEMFAAAVELRVTMEDKMIGSVEKAVNLIKKESLDVIKGMLYAPLAVGQAIIDLTGLITGGTKDAADLQNGAALTILAPQLLQTFENSIQNVKNGDTSDEAVQMVYMSYTMVKITLTNMCKIMTNIGNRQQEDEYKVILKKLNSMEIGDLIDLTN